MSFRDDVAEKSQDLRKRLKAMAEEVSVLALSPSPGVRDVLPGVMAELKNLEEVIGEAIQVAASLETKATNKETK
jgi:hypothetical protein